MIIVNIIIVTVMTCTNLNSSVERLEHLFKVTS